VPRTTAPCLRHRALRTPNTRAPRPDHTCAAPPSLPRSTTAFLLATAARNGTLTHRSSNLENSPRAPTARARARASLATPLPAPAQVGDRGAARWPRGFVALAAPRATCWKRAKGRTGNWDIQPSKRAWPRVKQATVPHGGPWTRTRPPDHKSGGNSLTHCRGCLRGRAATSRRRLHWRG